jgi:hypothetical protein
MLNLWMQQIVKALLPVADLSILPPPPSAPVTQPNHQSILTSLFATLAHNTDVLNGRCKSLATAMLTLRITQTMVDAEPSTPQSLKDKISTLIKMIEEVEIKQLQQNSFESKHVIVLEGLPATGKSTLAQRLSQQRPSLCYLDPKQTEIHAIMQNVLYGDHYGDGRMLADQCVYLPSLCHFLLNYYLAMQIIDNPAINFILEEYHHAFLTQQLSGKVDIDQVSQLAKNVFLWPIDLPMPELVSVVFISIYKVIMIGERTYVY